MNSNFLISNRFNIVLYFRENWNFGAPISFSAKFFSILDHFIILIRSCISNQNDLINLFCLTKLPDFIKQHLMSLVSKPTFRLDSCQKSLKFIGIFGEVGFLYNFFILRAVISEDHDFMLVRTFSIFLFYYLICSVNSFFQNIQHSIDGHSHRSCNGACAINSNDCLYNFTFRLHIV